MQKKLSLIIILVISIAGLLFSGYLSFSELILSSCPLGGCKFVLGLPSCVYGLVMYLVIFIISLIGLSKKSN